MRRLAVLLTCLVMTMPASAAVARMQLAAMVEEADFVGMVEVITVSSGVPLLRKPRATARVIEQWTGEKTDQVKFIAAPGWICDISTAIEGETAVVFIEGRKLVLAGRGRMPIEVRDGEEFAVFWDDVILPEALETFEGPEPEYSFIKSIRVSDLRDAVRQFAAD